MLRSGLRRGATTIDFATESCAQSRTPLVMLWASQDGGSPTNPDQTLETKTVKRQIAAPKYINSPESAVYKKSKLLFGLYQARDGIRTAGQVVLVEGNFDVIALHQAGVTETVAPLGTAFTSEQASMIHRLAGKAVLLYDGDRAGRKATLAALEVLVGHDVEVLIATLPTGQDPDSLAQSKGPEELRKFIKQAKPGIEYFIHEVWSRSSAIIR